MICQGCELRKKKLIRTFDKPPFCPYNVPRSLIWIHCKEVHIYAKNEYVHNGDGPYAGVE